MAVETGGGMYEEQLMSERSLNETSPKNSSYTKLHGVEEGDREFELNLAFDGSFENGQLEDIVEWLFQDYYKPFYFEGQSDRIMFGIIRGNSSIVHNGLKEGYLTVSVKTNSPYKYSRVKKKEIIGEKKHKIRVKGHKDTYPIYNIEKIGSGDIEIKNKGSNVKITNLNDKEKIYIDSMKEIIKTDIIGEYRYDNIVAGELEELYLSPGMNEVQLIGDAKINIEYREIYRF